MVFCPSLLKDDWQKLDIRVGKIIEVEDYPEARKPAYNLLKPTLKTNSKIN